MLAMAVAVEVLKSHDGLTAGVQRPRSCWVECQRG